MADNKSILIIHDTAYPEINETFKTWLKELYSNLRSASEKITEKSQKFVLSGELTANSDEIPELNFTEYDFYLILIHDELSRSKNLKQQVDQLLTHFKTSPDLIKEHKTEIIFLGEIPLDHEILQIKFKKIIKFYSEEGFNYYNKTKLINSQNREYWTKIFDILDLISSREDSKDEAQHANKRPTAIYIGRATPDLEGYRQVLINELTKRGIIVIPEVRTIPQTDIDHEALTDVLGYADMIIQLIGGKSGEVIGEKNITEVEEEFKIITDFISDKAKQTLRKEKIHSWVIWMPGSISASDKIQENFIAKIKRQLGYATWEMELITGTFEQLKEFIFDSLKTRIAYSPDYIDPKMSNYIYLIHEKSVYQEALEISLQLKSYPLHIELTHDLYLKPNFIQAHKEALQKCDGLFIYYGIDNIYWFESTIMDVIKVSNVQRTKPISFQAVIFNPALTYNLPEYKEFIYLPSDNLAGQELFKGTSKNLMLI